MTYDAARALPRDTFVPSPANPTGATFVLKGLPYFSHVRFTATRSGTTPNFIYTIPAGIELRAFGYRIGDNMGVAGRPTVQATACDTNVQKAGETIDGEAVYINGIALQLTGASDAALAKVAGREISAKISLAGGDRGQQLGNAEMIPGMSGLYSSASGVALSTGAAVGTASQGLPEVTNYFPIAGGLLWAPSGKTDSNFVVIMKTERPIVLAVSNANAPDSTDAAQTIFVDYRVQLVSRQESNRSPNL